MKNILGALALATMMLSVQLPEARAEIGSNGDPLCSPSSSNYTCWGPEWYWAWTCYCPGGAKD